MKKLNVTSFQINGFTLVEMLLSVAVFSVTAVSLTSFSLYMSKFDRAEKQSATIHNFKEELVTSLGNGKYWQNIVSKADTPHETLGAHINPELACVRDQTPCTEGSYDLTVLNLDGKYRFDAVDQTAGFSRGGSLCKGFSQSTGAASANCPFRFELKWSPICEKGTTTCVNPLIRISATLKSVSDLSINMNMADLNFNFVITNDPVSDPVITNLFLLTNSDVLNFGTSTLDIDLSAAVTYAGSISTLAFSVPTGLSQFGGVVQVAGSQLRYFPPAGFYGKDSINYNVTTPSGKVIAATVGVGVMTPHTWLGPAAGLGPGSTSVASNFCGKVVSGVCDRASFPGGGLDMHYIFNDLCGSCDAILDTNAHTMELASTYSSKVQVAANVKIEHNASNKWAKFPVYVQRNGTFEPKGFGTIFVTSTKIIPGARALNQRAFVLTGGTFTSPTWPCILGSAEFTGGTYNHNNSVLEVYGVAGAPDSNYFSANGISFYILSFGTAPVSANFGDHNGMLLDGNIIVKKDLKYYPEGDLDTLCAWEGGTVPTGVASSLVTITVDGNLYADKAGGRGSVNGCKSPTVTFAKAGNHIIFGPPNVDYPASNFTGAWGVYDTAWTTVLNQIKNRIPYLPYIKIADPSVSLTVNGFIGLRRGLENASDSSINFLNANIVLAHADPGNSFFKPETVAGSIKNPLKNLFLAGTGGGQVQIASRQIQVKGNLYTAFDGNTMLASDLAPGAVIHLQGDYVMGPGLVFKNQAAVPNAVHTIFDGTVDQILQGSPSSWGDFYVPFEITIDKPSGTLHGKDSVNLLRSFNYISGTPDFGTIKPIDNTLQGMLLFVADQGVINNYVVNLNFVKPNVRIATLHVAHNFKVPNSFQADSIILGQGIITYGPRTIEFGPTAVLKTMELQFNNTDGSNPQPFTVVGPNYMHMKITNERDIYTNTNPSQISAAWGGRYVLNQVQFDLEGKFSDGVRRRIDFASSGMEFPGSIVNVAPNTLVCQWPYDSLTVGDINIGAGSGWMKQFGPLTSGTVTGAPMADRKAGYQCWNEYQWEMFGIWGPAPP
jgi:prepilin-type N-terminal cleavage/methylation domain-containing protein